MRTAALALVVLLLVASSVMATDVYWVPAHAMAPPVVYGLIAWGDLDADGDVDVSEASTEYWNDGGCPGPPAWRPQTYVLPVISGCSSCQEALGDLDADGDLDLVAGCFEPHMYLYWNVGTPQVPAWQYGASIFDGYYYSVPRLADLDGDGDLDLIVYADFQHVRLRENTGSAQVPEWGTPWVTLPLTSLMSRGAIAVGDLDGDGDFDIVGFTSDVPLKCWENVGSPQEWQFVENPAMLTGVDAPVGGWGLALPDVDCDGDPDLLMRVLGGAVFLYLNESVTPVAPASWGTIKGMYR